MYGLHLSCLFEVHVAENKNFLTSRI